MEAKDVGISNWVLVPASLNRDVTLPTLPKQIKGITIFGEFDFTIPLAGQQQIVNAAYSAGIPLTEKWLLEAGFGREIIVASGVDQVVYTLNNVTVVCKNKDEEYEHHETPAKLLYVHQLQNLYYVITGKELGF